MEGAQVGSGTSTGGGDHDEEPQQKRQLSRRSSLSSFKLRSPSLNSLRLRRVFDLFDKNGDGLLSVEEIHQALVALGLDADPEELRSIITSFLIPPGSPALSYQDFHSLHASLNRTFFFDDDDDDQTPHEAAEDEVDQQVDSDLTEAFKVFDEDGDGYISAAELQRVLSKLGLPEANHHLDRIQLMISSVDHNHDGRVDFPEFKHMMLHSVLLLPSS